MKYFTSDLWMAMNSEIDERRSQAVIEWNENVRKYNNHVKEIKHCLSLKSQKVFLNNYGFHDYFVEDMKMFRNRKSKYKNNYHIIVYPMKNPFLRYEITYINISRVQYQYLEDTKHNMRDSKCIDAWGFSEFDITENGNIIHNVLFSSQSELLILCDKVIIKKLKK